MLQGIAVRQGEVLKNGSRVLIEWPLASIPHPEKKRQIFIWSNE